MKEWKQVNKKLYVPTYMDIKFNVCDFTNNGNSSSSILVKEAIKRFNPFFFETMGQVIHSCPYEVNFCPRSWFPIFEILIFKGKLAFSTQLAARTFSGADALLSGIGDYKFEVEFFSDTKLCFSTVSYKKVVFKK
jgi:hypothetical protein